MDNFGYNIRMKCSIYFKKKNGIKYLPLVFWGAALDAFFLGGGGFNSIFEA